MAVSQGTLTIVPNDESPADQVGEVVGSYKLEKLLGVGAMGRVYLGRHTRLDRLAALKILHPKHIEDPVLVQRFLQEAKTVNQINHHHIVEVHDFVEEMLPERVYCVMELLSGQTLMDRMNAGPLSLEHTLRICRQVAEALGAAHQVGVVHRDVKPDNIFLVSREGQNDYVKVLDFGVAKLMESLGKVSLVDTLSGQVVGTPRYMSPEQAAGIEVDHRADIYALGTIMYELLAGRPPFVANTFGQLSAEIITRPPPPLPATTPTGDEIPKPLSTLVMACLAKSADDRPTDMGAVATRIDQVLELSAPDTASAAPRKLPVRLLALGGAALVALVVVLLVRPWASEPVAPPPRVVVKEVPAPPPAKPKTVTLAITTTPPGATVTRRDTGATLGVTPFTAKVDRLDGEVPLDIALNGYEPAERTVRFDANGAVDLALTPKAKKRKNVVQDGVLDPFAD